MRPPCIPPQFVDWTLSDGYVVRGRWWPSDAARGVAIVYLHGIQSHGGWYEWSAARLAAEGLPVAMPDRRGSGLNAAARGDTPSMERWLADLDDLSAAITRTVGVRKFALVGVSWGGKLAVAWALRHPGLVSTILLVAPGLFPQVGVGFLEKARIGAGLLTGGRARHHIPLDDPALFTGNPAGQSFIADDPLKLTTATARFLFQSVRLDRLLVRASAGSLTSPTTLVLAEGDQIIRNQLTSRWLQRVSRDPPRIAELSKAAHTLEFEPDVRDLERELLLWTRAV